MERIEARGDEERSLVEKSLWGRLRLHEPEALHELELIVNRVGRRLLSSWRLPRFAHDECLKDALSRIWLGLEAGREEPRDMEAFAWRQVQGAVTQWLRFHRPRKGVVPLHGLEPEPVAQPEPLERARLEELARSIEECLASIRNPRAREAWRLRHEEQPPRKAREVAALMRAPLGSVLAWWKAANDHMEQCLSSKEGWE
jgi:DNA-directed RNA polymerase specialized sigma24 family protein